MEMSSLNEIEMAPMVKARRASVDLGLEDSFSESLYSNESQIVGPERPGQ